MGRHLTAVILRCDGSPRVGMGHVIRSSALAGALRDRGRRPIFHMPDSAAAARGFVRGAGFEVTTGDGPACNAAAGAAAVVVDSYALDGAALSALRNAVGAPLGVIDDLADRDLRAADWVLNQNFGAEALPMQVRDGCVRALGPAYALLRPEFAAARRELQRAFRPGDRRVLLALGGGDTTAESARVARALLNLDVPLHVRCVLGGAADDEAVRQGGGAVPSGSQLEVLRNVGAMAPLMAWADVAVCAGGITTWELFALGLPVVVLPGSADQRANAARLSAAGLAAAADGPDAPQRAAAAVRDLLGDPDRRAAISRRVADLVDGEGARRAAASLLETLGGGAA